jgi:hypothetical protein
VSGLPLPTQAHLLDGQDLYLHRTSSVAQLPAYGVASKGQLRINKITVSIGDISEAICKKS